MTTGPQHRTLSDQLRGWTPDQVAQLLERRPDLVHPRPPVDIAELAQRAQHRPSVDAAIAATTLPENRLLQIVVCCRPDVTVDELALALPEGIALDDVEGPLSALEAAALVWRHGGRAHCSGTLRQAMPTTLGPPLSQLVKEQTVDYLKSAVRLVRTALDDQRFAGPLPARATGPDGRPPRKAELVEELESLVVAPGVVDAVLASGPPDCTWIAHAMAEGPPVVELDEYLYFSTYNRGGSVREQPTSWLFQRGLVLPLGDGQLGVMPREVGVALRGGRPVADLVLDPPVLVAGAVEPDRVDAHGAARVRLTLDRLTDLLDRWEEAPAKTLKSGGLGVAVMKQTAAALETDADEATRLVELAHLAGLVDTTTVARKEKRTYVYESLVGPGPAAPAWRERPVPERWRQLAGAWLRAEHWPSAPGRKGPDAKATPVMSAQYAATAPELRRRVLDVLASLAPGTATTPDALSAHVYWRRPQPWLGRGTEGPTTVIGWVHAEAELLGLVAGGSLSSFGRALLADDRRRAEQALEAALPEPATTFTLQADLTATVVGALERSVAVELRLLADVESTGSATTLRFSDASLRRALDAGRDGEAILAFLDAHATKGVPKALAYLVSDVARRHGHLQVGPAASFVTSEDPAALADACSHRRTRKLALRLLAPTVAVGPHPVAKVMSGLREAGFLPTADGAEALSVSIDARGAPSPARPANAGDGNSGAGLPEPFRARAGSRQRSVPVLDSPTAAKLAESILAGPPPGTSPSPAEPVPLPMVFPGGGPDHAVGDEVPGNLMELLEWAFDNSRALAIALGDEDHLAEPVPFAIIDWAPDRVLGIDLTDGVPMSILAEHIGSATDLGPVDEIASVALLEKPRRRAGGRRRRR